MDCFLNYLLNLLRLYEDVLVRINKGSNVSLKANISGNLEQFSNHPTNSIVSEFVIESDGIVLNYENEDILILKKAVLSNGGRFEIVEYESMLDKIESINTAQTLESLFRVFVVLLKARSYGQDARLYLKYGNTSIDPVIVKGVTMSFIESKIKESLIKPIKENCNALSEDFNLCDALGIE